MKETEDQMNFQMVCTTCKDLVLVNATGTCLACQKGFCSSPQEDSWKYHQNKLLELKLQIELQKEKGKKNEYNR